MTPIREAGSSRMLHLGFALILLFLLVPLLVIIPMSFSETRYLAFPPVGFSLKWYGAFFQNPRWIGALGWSVGVAICAALVAVPAGVCAALYLRHRSGAVVNVVLGALLGAQIVPTIILALGIRLVTAPFTGSLPVVVVTLAHATLALPFVVATVLPVLNKLDVSVEKAARMCGATPVQAFRHITIPAIRPALVGAFVFSFFVSFDELMIALFTFQTIETLPVRIWGEVRQELTPVIAAATSMLIAATTAAVIVGQAHIVRASSRLADK